MTKKAIITTHDDREATIVTKASNVLFEDGQTAQDILNDRQDTMITPVITTSTSMSKVGQGDSVDYSENVVDGAYESCVLKGNTKVNLIQEPSSQDVVLPYEFTDGQSVTITDTKESGALGVELKGQTLVNLLESSNIRITNGSVNEINFAYGLDTSKTYILKYRINTMPTLTDTSDAARLVKLEWYNNSSGGFKNILVGDITVGENKYVKIPPFNGEVTQNSFRLWSPLFSSGELDIDLALLEYQQGMENWDIPYFEGMQSVRVPSVTTIGKNILCPKLLNSVIKNSVQEYNGVNFNYNISDGSFTVTGTFNGDVTLHGNSNEFIKLLKHGKNYCSSEQMLFEITSVDGSNRWTNTFTFDKNNHVRVSPYYQWLGVKGTTIDKTYYPQIEESQAPTTYEPYKSNILSTSEDIELRGIGNVKDTLNLSTGEYTQRIGEIVLDGNDMIMSYIGETTNVLMNTSRCYVDYSTISKANMKKWGSATSIATSIICDSLPIKEVTPTMQEVDEEAIGLSTAGFSIRLTGRTISECKNRLSQNPVTIQYELATPITRKVDLSIINQDNQVVSKLSTYNTATHINASSQEGSLIPTLSHVNPSYPVILKPSTKYSIVANSYSNGHTNSPINFNLGGATASTVVGNRVTTITTPSTLTSEELAMSGRGNKLNNVMVIEGDVAGDEPYFEGICDCKSPILSNVGKNLFDWEAHHWRLNRFQWSHGDGGLGNGNALGRAGVEWVSIKTLKLKPSQTYYTNGYISFYENDGKGLCIDRCNHTGIFTVPTNAEIACVSAIINDGVKLEYMFDPKIIISEIEMEYEPYKSNILSANGDKIELTEDMFEEGGIGGYSGHLGKTYKELKSVFPSSLSGKRLMTVDLVKVKPNTSYNINSSDNFAYFACSFNANKIANGGTDTGYVKSTIFTTSSDTHYIAIIVKRDNDGSINMLDFKNNNFTLSEVDKTIVLRSLPNGVCDTLNVETGEYVQRIKEIVLDGSSDESWVKNTSLSDNNYTVLHNIGYTGMKVETHSLVGNMNCDKFKNEWYAIDGGEGVARYVNGTEIVLKISTSKLTTQDTTGLRTYLQSNPITVQYELQTPIVKTVDLSGYPFSYENGHVVLSSGSIEQSLTPKVEYSVATNRNGQIRSNQKMVEKHQKELDKLQAIILANLINSQYSQLLTTLKYELSRV